MNKNKPGSIELPDRKRETTNRKPRIAVCGKMAKPDLKRNTETLRFMSNGKREFVSRT